MIQVSRILESAGFHWLARTNRRGALAGILGFLTATISCVLPRNERVQHGKVSEPVDTDLPDPSRRQLIQDLAQLNQRAYSEEGIAVFLVCENATRSGRGIPADLIQASNAPFLAAFRRLVKEIPRVRPEVTQDDVPKLIELLAARDFGAPRTDTGL